jgi:uncharacterized protein YdaU (DUF1376 family)
MVADKFPYFRWYPADCDTDDKVCAMNDREFGFYMRCLNRSWRNDGIPSDLKDLARTMGRSDAYIRKVWPRIAPCFHIRPDDPAKMVNPRQEREREAVRTKSKKATSAVQARYGRSRSVLPRALARAVSDSDSSEKKGSAEGKPNGGLLDPNLTESEPAYWIERFYTRHPKKKNLPVFQEVLVEWWGVQPDPVAAIRKIDVVHAEFCKTEDWRKSRGNFAPKIDEWWCDRGWTGVPVTESRDPYRLATEDD